MKKMPITVVTTAALLVASGAWIYRRADASEAPTYRTAVVERANLQSMVSATGALSAVRTVQVGTQVSGQVSAIYVDFNDHVKKGELLARIDPTLQQQAVQDAEAQLDRAKAQLAQATGEYDRNKTMFDAKIVTASEFGTIQSNYAVAQANVKSAQISVDRARQNLAYTSIYAPIDGVVVERNVNVGQTVAASLSAPQLFLIANDLKEMQILASVDESDIGQISEGQPVRFSVQSYANRSFDGTVRQVRLQSTTQNNVVNYTAVVAVSNDEGKLLPGMTATVKFITGSADSVLTVPNTALGFRPTSAEAVAPNVGQRAQGQSAANGAAAPGAQGAGGTARAGAANGGAPAGQVAGVAGGAAQANGAQRSRQGAVIWTLDANGKLVPHRVKTGLTDGQKTQIEGQGIAEGTEVVIGAGSATAATPNAAASSPFQQPNTQRRGPGGAF